MIEKVKKEIKQEPRDPAQPNSRTSMSSSSGIPVATSPMLNEMMEDVVWHQVAMASQSELMEDPRFHHIGTPTPTAIPVDDREYLADDETITPETRVSDF